MNNNVEFLFVGVDWPNHISRTNKYWMRNGKRNRHLLLSYLPQNKYMKTSRTDTRVYCKLKYRLKVISSIFNTIVNCS